MEPPDQEAARMGKAYSNDLRKRVVGAVERGLSCHEAAERFGVGVSTAIRWARRFKDTGSFAAHAQGGRRRVAIDGPQRVWLIERCAAKDFTLRGLVAELAERGLAVDYRSVWNFVHAENLSYKKKRSRV
jgi:putative transposase